MSETSMIERVARALSHSTGLEYDSLPDEAKDGEDKAWFRSMARAAIEAMREPTWEMQILNGSIYWPNLIDAALSPNKETDR